jgi:hypothetical protein
MASDGERSVQCSGHGQVTAAFVCTHLFDQLVHKSSVAVGFFEPDVQDEEPNGWCRECDAVMRREGGWNDASEAFAGSSSSAPLVSPNCVCCSAGSMRAADAGEPAR